MDLESEAFYHWEPMTKVYEFDDHLRLHCKIKVIYFLCRRFDIESLRILNLLTFFFICTFFIAIFFNRNLVFLVRFWDFLILLSLYVDLMKFRIFLVLIRILNNFIRFRMKEYLLYLCWRLIYTCSLPNWSRFLFSRRFLILIAFFFHFMS